MAAISLSNEQRHDEYLRLLRLIGYKTIVINKYPQLKEVYDIIIQNPSYLYCLMKIFDCKWVHPEYKSTNINNPDIHKMWMDMQSAVMSTHVVADVITKDGIGKEFSNTITPDVTAYAILDHVRDMNAVRDAVPIEYNDSDIFKVISYHKNDYENDYKKLKGEEEVIEPKNESLLSKHKNSSYEILDEEDEYGMMAAEDTPYDYYDDTEELSYAKDGWNSIQRSTDRPKSGTKVLVCGYIYRGVIEYVTGTYEGHDEWDLELNNKFVPNFHVLYWQPIHEVEGAEEEI